MSFARLAACLLLVASSSLIGAEIPAVRVVLGKVVERSYEQLAKEGFVYGPRQTYDSATRETHIFLPYGDGPLVTTGAVNAAFTTAHSGAQAEVSTLSSSHTMTVQYRLEFSQAIGSFRCLIGPYTELVLAPTSTAGVEYSVDGKTWRPVGTAEKGTRAVVNPLLANTTVIDGLDTRILLLRIVTRDSEHPESDTGPEMYLKMRISGDPAWGDVRTTFFTSQNQIWVTPKQARR